MTGASLPQRKRHPDVAPSTVPPYAPPVPAAAAAAGLVPGVVPMRRCHLDEPRPTAFKPPRGERLPQPPALGAVPSLPSPGPALDFTAPSEAALLQVLLGCTQEAAERMLASAGGLVRLARFDVDDLMALTGASRADAERIAAACELGRRGLVAEVRPAGKILGAAAIARWFRLRIGGMFIQQIWVVGLDEAGALCGAQRVSHGDVHGAALDAVEVLAHARSMRARSLLLVHNHPSGDVTVTPHDLRFALRVHRAALAAGITLTDVIIVGPVSHYMSMAESGTLPGGI